MNKMKLFLGIILFGSLWGFLECIIGPKISGFGFQSGVFMTSIFAIGLMTLTRIIYKQRGMQIGMGLVAGSLRMFNPFGGCIICSAIAIAAEGIIFEMIWYKISLDLKQLNTYHMKISMGIISAYLCYVGGYITTQIFTPLIASSGFYFNDIFLFLPKIFSSGLIAAIIGGVTIPAIILLKNFDINSIQDKIYYTAATAVSVFCWFIVISNALFFIRI